MTNASTVTSHDVPVIELKNVHVIHTSRTGKLFRPDKVHAVDDVSMKVFKGKTLGIVGESGCGKSTTARVMVGLQKPTKGDVLFRGEQAEFNASGRKEIGRAVSVVFQDPATALNPRMIVRDALTDPLRVHGIGTPQSRVERVKELLDLVGLPQSALEVLPRQIYGGQRQRVAIARALVLDPDIIIADEPTSALDVSVRAQVLNLLTDLKERLGLGLVFISHDINTVRFISDRIAVMNKGKVVEEQSTHDIFTNAHDDYTRMLLSAVPSLVQEPHSGF